MFDGFNSKVNSIVGSALNKLGISVINDIDDERIAGKPDDKVKQFIKDKNKLLADDLKNQIKQNSNKMLGDIKHQLSLGIAAGKTPAEIKSEVEAQFNYEDGVGWKFQRTINTSSRQIAGLLRLRKYQKMGFEDFKWQDMGDSKVRPSHKAKNGRIFKIEDALKSPKMDAYPGKDFNCRCKALPW